MSLIGTEAEVLLSRATEAAPVGSTVAAGSVGILPQALGAHHEPLLAPRTLSPTGTGGTSRVHTRSRAPYGSEGQRPSGLGKDTPRRSVPAPSPGVQRDRACRAPHSLTRCARLLPLLPSLPPTLRELAGVTFQANGFTKILVPGPASDSCGPRMRKP